MKSPIEELRKRMKKYDLKQREIAEMLQTTGPQISMLLRGRSEFKADMAFKLERAGVMSAKDVLRWEMERQLQETQKFLKLSVEQDCLK